MQGERGTHLHELYASLLDYGDNVFHVLQGLAGTAEVQQQGHSRPTQPHQGHPDKRCYRHRHLPRHPEEPLPGCRIALQLNINLGQDRCQQSQPMQQNPVNYELSGCGSDTASSLTGRIAPPTAYEILLDAKVFGDTHLEVAEGR